MHFVKNIWRVIASNWCKNMLCLVYLSLNIIILFLEAHSFPRATYCMLSENFLFLGTANVHRQKSKHISVPNKGYCLFTPCSINTCTWYSCKCTVHLIFGIPGTKLDRKYWWSFSYARLVRLPFIYRRLPSFCVVYFTLKYVSTWWESPNCLLTTILHCEVSLKNLIGSLLPST